MPKRRIGYDFEMMGLREFEHLKIKKAGMKFDLIARKRKRKTRPKFL